MRRLLAAATTAVLGLGLLVLPSGPAHAVETVQPLHDRLVSDDPANFTPHILDGQVDAIAVVGSRVIVGGQFTRAQNASGGPELSRVNILAFNRTTGIIDTGFVPNADGRVRTLAPAPDGASVYVGGQFNTLGGQTARKIARLNTATGLKVAGFNPGIPESLVYDLKLVGNRLFIGGQFTKINAVSRSLLAELDPNTGALRPTGSAVFAGVHASGTTHIYKFDVNPAGTQLTAIGNFRTVNGLNRVQIAVLDITGPATLMNDWRTTKYEQTCFAGFEYYIRDVEYAPDGSYFTTTSTGGYPNAPNSLCDAVVRWHSTDRSQDVQPGWVDHSGGDSFYAVAATGAVIYVGGHQRWFNNPFASDAVGPGAVPRQGIGAVDPANGVPLSWDPQRTRGRGVFDMVSTDDGLWVGSDTDRIGHFEYHGRIAFFPLVGGNAVPQPDPAPLPVDVYTVGAPSARYLSRVDTGGSEVASSDAGPNWAVDTQESPSPYRNSGSNASPVSVRAFDGNDAGASAEVPPGSPNWGIVRGGFWLDGLLYLASTDGTFTVRSFTGGAFGAPTTLNLYGLTQFQSEMAQMTGLFYSEGYLYFTLFNDPNMYRRGFSVESGIVAALRDNVSAGGIDWRQVRGTFISNGALYWTAAATGDLHRVTFTTAAQAGTDAIVSGPGVDGQDWRGTLMFALPGPPPNQPPTASFDESCSDLSCSFDGTDSSDPDGSISGYAWDFGDGDFGSGPAPGHAYDVAGTYLVTLTVTDDDGATGTTSHNVTVAESAIAFVGSAQDQNSGSKVVHQVVLPPAVAAGDVMVLSLSINSVSATVNDPAGWARVDQAATSGMTTVMWTRTATAGMGGSTVTVTTGSSVRDALVVSVYRDAELAPGQLDVVNETVNRATHTTPTRTAVAGSWVVSFWTDKTASTTSWVAPGGQSVRQTGAGSGAGHMSWLVTDSNGAVAAGPVGGLTATANSSSAQATMATVVLSPVN